MIRFDLLLTCHGWVYPIMHLINSLANQQVVPVRVIVLVWKECLVVELQELADRIHQVVDPWWSELIIQHAYYSDHEQWRGVGYDRWFLINQAKSDYLCTIDEDNVLAPWQLDAWLRWYETVVQSLGREAIVSPTIMREGQIQSQWITGFSYLFPQYTFGRCGEKPRQEVKMVWANSLFGRTQIFQRIQFDPDFAGSYEDIDFSSRVVQAGYGVVVLRDVTVDHQEPKKSFLGELFLGTERSAYLRSKNRIIRVRKTATIWQKIQYFSCGLWIQTAGWMRYITRSWVRQKRKLIWAIRKWIGAWLIHTSSSST
jgi:GT2 family glycosyltransferase